VSEDAGQAPETPVEISELDQAKHLLHMAVSEISSLRREVEFLQPKADAWDVMSRVVKNIPQSGKGYGIDVRWQIEAFLNPLTPDTAGKEGPVQS
jgi:hypothetical protein